MQSSQICKLTRIYCFSPNMLDIGWISRVGVNIIFIHFLNGENGLWSVLHSVFPLRTQLLCVQSPFSLSSLFTKRKKSHFTLCSLVTNGKKMKKSSFCCCKILNCQLINYSMWKLLRWSSVSPVSSTLSPKLELQIICKHEKKTFGDNSGNTTDGYR